MTKLAVIGTTSWGTTLAVVLARKGLDVWLWARTAEVAEELESRRENSPILPGIRFPDNLRVTHNIDRALKSASAVIFAVPSQSMRRNAEALAGRMEASSALISAAKGLELSTNLRMSQVLAEALDVPLSSVCVLSGPNLAGEMARGLPAASVLASQRPLLAEKARHLLSCNGFCIQVSDDVTGVELSGSLKNVIALGAGVADGLALGDNAKALLVTQGWGEITALGMAMGAKESTFSGLAGLGDLYATCASPLSRNHYYGEQLAKGRTLAQIMDSTPHVAEGIPTTRAAYELSRDLRVDMPIIRLMYGLLFEDLPPHKAVDELMAITARIAGKVA
ncbi:MAG: NAD(P)H-dependent glycerol-3-phosphate dehydrogenase [Dehalococcoidia bacterium]|nr:NAD(P)H-dependent glycerol-3-phosphate dehydrogenase [Dehalococcoidia bacterium]